MAQENPPTVGIGDKKELSSKIQGKLRMVHEENTLSFIELLPRSHATTPSSRAMKSVWGWNPGPLACQLGAVHHIPSQMLYFFS